MGRPFAYDVPDFSGGLNESAAEKIAENECAELSNAYVDGPSILGRAGRTLLAGPYTEEILGVYLYKPSFETAETIILACRSGFARVDGAAILAIESADGVVLSDSDKRWWGEQYNDEMFFCRSGAGGVRRLYGHSVIASGIAAPTTAPVIVDGGAGKKIAGTYKVAVRYKNTLVDSHSNWSPVSNAVVLVDNHRLYVSSIPTSPNRQVNAREIGCTRPNEDVLYVVGQINDNVTTTYYENASAAVDGEYGEADVDENSAPITDVRHGLPPEQAVALAVHKERLFVLDYVNSALCWSEPGWMQSFRSSSTLPVTKGTGLMSWEQHGLVILCESDAHILLGDTPNDWRIDKFSREHGCPAGKSAAIGDGILFWYTGTNIVMSQGGSPQILPRIERIRATLDLIPETLKHDVWGETIPSKGWYVLSVPQTGTTRKLIIYDYVHSAFAVVPQGPMTLARLRRGSQAEAIYASITGNYNLYEFLSGTTDDGSAITTTLTTKAFGYETPGVMKATRRVSLQTPNLSGSLTLYVYHDGTLVATRSGLSLAGAEPWKRFAVAASGRPGTTVQVKAVYSGSVPFRGTAMQIEGVLLPGRRPRPR
jgi:hypothetical protein